MDDYGTAIDCLPLDEWENYRQWQISRAAYGGEAAHVALAYTEQQEV